MIYAAMVAAGKERDAADELRRRGITVILPEATRLIRRGGKWLTENRIIFIGYIFISADMNAEVWHMISASPGIIRLLGSEAPQPLTKDECEWLRYLANGGEPIPVSDGYTSGGKLYGVTGVLKELEATVTWYSIRRKRFLARVSVGGKEHLITLSAEIKTL